MTCTPGFSLSLTRISRRGEGTWIGNGSGLEVRICRPGSIFRYASSIKYGAYRRPSFDGASYSRHTTCLGEMKLRSAIVIWESFYRGLISFTCRIELMEKLV